MQYRREEQLLGFMPVKQLPHEVIMKNTNRFIAITALAVLLNLPLPFINDIGLLNAQETNTELNPGQARELWMESQQEVNDLYMQWQI